MGYDIIPLREWVGPEEFLKLYKGDSLRERIKLILTSKGSLTKLLEDLYKSPIELELKSQSMRSIEDDTTEFLGIERGEKVLERDAWLKRKRKRLVFAHSVIPIRGLNRDLIHSLGAGDKPLGCLLERAGISVQRDSWKIGMIKCGEVAGDLLLSPDQSFWARRYYLRSGDRALAVITEVFSPTVFEVREKERAYGECHHS